MTALIVFVICFKSPSNGKYTQEKLFSANLQRVMSNFETPLEKLIFFFLNFGWILVTSSQTTYFVQNLIIFLPLIWPGISFYLMF